jgi:hypothetical protein
MWIGTVGQSRTGPQRPEALAVSSSTIVTVARAGFPTWAPPVGWLKETRKVSLDSCTGSLRIGTLTGLLSSPGPKVRTAERGV